MYQQPTRNVVAPAHPPSYRDAMYVPSRELAGANASRPPKNYEPLTLRNWAVAVIVVSLIGLAIALEAALAYSTKHGGFSTPQRNVFSGVSPRFLTAFFPTLLVAGLLLIWQSSDRSYRELQPYIVLAKGNATAAEGLLANYSGLSVYRVIINSIKFRHFLILLSTITTLLGSFLQPLAGSIISIQDLPETQTGIFVKTKNTIGLAPDVEQLNAFLAAAGFAEAAVFHSLPDPPFVRGGWAVSEFELPAEAVLNGTLAVNTTAIQTTAHCEAATTFELTTPGTANFSIRATNAAGCVGFTTFNPETSALNNQYGAASVPDCGGGTEVKFQPVMFWFFHRKNDDIGTPQGASVFCSPTIKAFNVIAETDLNNGSISRIIQLDPVTTSNNVTGSPLNGVAFNSVKFAVSDDSFVQARAVSITSGISGAIFRFAWQLPDGLQSVFDDPNGFLNITNKVFTQHLSISAKSIYFVAGESSSPASLVSLVRKLWIDEFPTHFLAALLTLIGLSALFLHIAHSRQRRRFFLAASPGSIAHIISMTAHARFGERLYPYDDDETLARKLAGLRFGLDPRTGAVVADRDAYVGGMTPYEVTSSVRRQRAPAVDVAAGAAAGKESEDANLSTARLLPPGDDEKHTDRGRSLSRAPSSSAPSMSPNRSAYFSSAASTSALGLDEPAVMMSAGPSNHHDADAGAYSPLLPPPAFNDTESSSSISGYHRFAVTNASPSDVEAQAASAWGNEKRERR